MFCVDLSFGKDWFIASSLGFLLMNLLNLVLIASEYVEKIRTKKENSPHNRKIFSAAGAKFGTLKELSVVMK